MAPEFQCSERSSDVVAPPLLSYIVSSPFPRRRVTPPQRRIPIISGSKRPESPAGLLQTATGRPGRAKGGAGSADR